MARWVGRAATVFSIVCTTSLAHAYKPVDVYSIWYSADTTNKVDVEQFLGCLTQASTFGGSWSQQWGIGPITVHSAIVLTTTPPNLQVGTSLEDEINRAIAAGTVPGPTSDDSSVYIVHGPSTVRNSDSSARLLCYQSPYCAEHGPGTYFPLIDAGAASFSYQAALVPLDCPCGGTIAPLPDATFLTEHELGESLADEGTATFETADACEKHPDALECCGKTYTIQWLDTTSGPGQCQSIPATGTKCSCGVVGFGCTDASSCCSGMSCDAWLSTPDESPQMSCCYDVQQSCNAPNDCCGGLTCESGTCTCRERGDSCVRDADCCDESLICNPTAHVCGPKMSASGDAGDDAGDDGGGDGSGCSCHTVSTSGRSPWRVAIAVGFVIACVRRRRTRHAGSTASAK